MSYSDEENIKKLIEENRKTKDSFIFYRSWYEAMEFLSQKDKAELLRCIIEYNLNQEMPDNIDEKVWRWIAPYWRLIKPNIDANIRKYKNGCKGGRPPKNKPK